MRNCFAVCSLAVVFCLVVCVSVNAEVTKETATKEVGDAKQAVTAVHERAQSEFTNANRLLQRVESAKSTAIEAASKSQTAAIGNTDAVGIAETIKRLLGEVDKLYATENLKLDNAVNTLNTLLSDARKLNGKTDITIEPDAESSQDYTGTKDKAAALKGEADALNGQIDTAIAPIAGVGAKAEEMETKTKEAQLKDAHVSAIVAVATIDTILGKADTTIGQIERKKNAVSGIVDEMQTLKTNNPTVSDANIEALHQNADNAFRDATDAVQNANSARAAIQTQKGLADAALAKVKDENQEVSEAQNEASTAEACVTASDKIVLQLDNALQAATNSVTKAKDAKQKLETALSKATSATRLEQSVTNHKVKPLQDSVSADVKAIQTMMGEADSILLKTENQKKQSMTLFKKWRH